MNYALSFPATLLECGGWGWNCEEVMYINPATVEWMDRFKWPREKTASCVLM